MLCLIGAWNPNSSLKECLNNLLQGPYFAWEDILHEASRRVDIQWRSDICIDCVLVCDPSIDAEAVAAMVNADGGVLSDYNVEVVEKLMHEFEASIINAETEEGEELMAQCEEQTAFLVERHFCWSTIRFTEGFFW